MSAAPDTQPSPSTPASGPASIHERRNPTDEIVERFDRALESFSVATTEEQREHLHARLVEIVDDLDRRGVPMFSARSGPLRINRVRLAGLLPFPGQIAAPYEFDFDKTPSQVVAIVGRNGRGKSTLVEAPIGAIFGRTFSRGPLDEISIRPDEPWQVGTDFETATGAWRVERRRGNVAVCRAGERQPIARGRDAVAAWCRANVPSPMVLQAGAFGVQKHRGHLLQLEPAPARDVVLSMLGLEVYQAISKAAGERMRVVDAEATKQAGRVEELQRSVNADHGVAEQIDVLLSDLEQAREWLANAEAAHVAAVSSAANHVDEATRVRQLVAVERELHDLHAKLAKHEAVLAEALNVVPSPDVANLDAVADDASARLADVREQLRVVNERVANATGLRIAKLRVAVQELGQKRKDAPTMSVRTLLEDNVAAQNARQDLIALDELRISVVLAEQAHAAAVRASIDVREPSGHDVDVPELQAAIKQIQSDITRLEHEAEPLRNAPAVPPDNTHELAENVNYQRGVVVRLERELAVARSRIERAKEARDRLDAQVAHAEALTLERHDWWLICEMFGRTGIQGQAIDEIGPTIDEHANRLLDECADGRWVVKTESTANGAENGRETFEIWVYDREQDVRWKNGRNLSPGESGIVGEAIAGAVAMIASAAHPHVRPTIVRDEIAVDIDRLDVQTWMRILRREAEIMNAAKVLVVSHDRNVVAACDTRLLVQHGQVVELRE